MAAGSDADTLIGLAGDDTLSSYQGAASIDGGIGTDWWWSNFANILTPIVMDFAAGSVGVTGMSGGPVVTVTGIDNVSLSSTG